ncbi:hypothetical protein E4U53_006321 [Claviceps sorghi]|nr:hypothetical protein E4U53_006321 [Claviceps sorghi]
MQYEALYMTPKHSAQASCRPELIFKWQQTVDEPRKPTGRTIGGGVPDAHGPVQETWRLRFDVGDTYIQS